MKKYLVFIGLISSIFIAASDISFIKDFIVNRKLLYQCWHETYFQEIAHDMPLIQSYIANVIPPPENTDEWLNKTLSYYLGISNTAHNGINIIPAEVYNKYMEQARRNKQYTSMLFISFINMHCAQLSLLIQGFMQGKIHGAMISHELIDTYKSMSTTLDEIAQAHERGDLSTLEISKIVTTTLVFISGMPHPCNAIAWTNKTTQAYHAMPYKISLFEPLDLTMNYNAYNRLCEIDNSIDFAQKIEELLFSPKPGLIASLLGSISHPQNTDKEELQYHFSLLLTMLYTSELLLHSTYIENMNNTVLMPVATKLLQALETNSIEDAHKKLKKIIQEIMTSPIDIPITCGTIAYNIEKTLDNSKSFFATAQEQKNTRAIIEVAHILNLVASIGASYYVYSQITSNNKEAPFSAGTVVADCIFKPILKVIPIVGSTLSNTFDTIALQTSVGSWVFEKISWTGILLGASQASYALGKKVINKIFQKNLKYYYPLIPLRLSQIMRHEYRLSLRNKAIGLSFGKLYEDTLEN